MDKTVFATERTEKLFCRGDSLRNCPADRIVVLEDGQIVEIGVHAEWLAGNGLYTRLQMKQS